MSACAVMLFGPPEILGLCYQLNTKLSLVESTNHINNDAVESRFVTHYIDGVGPRVFAFHPGTDLVDIDGLFGEVELSVAGNIHHWQVFGIFLYLLYLRDVDFEAELHYMGCKHEY